MKNQNEMILMQDLNKKEMKEVNGGFLPVVVITVAVGGYFIYRYFRR